MLIRLRWEICTAPRKSSASVTVSMKPLRERFSTPEAPLIFLGPHGRLVAVVVPDGKTYQRNACPYVQVHARVSPMTSSPVRVQPRQDQNGHGSRHTQLGQGPNCNRFHENTRLYLGGYAPGPNPPYMTMRKAARNHPRSRLVHCGTNTAPQSRKRSTASRRPRRSPRRVSVNRSAYFRR